MYWNRQFGLGLTILPKGSCPLLGFVLRNNRVSFDDVYVEGDPMVGGEKGLFYG